MSQEKRNGSKSEPTQWISNVQITGVTRKALHEAVKRYGYRSNSAFFSEKARELVGEDPRREALACLKRAVHLIETDAV